MKEHQEVKKKMKNKPVNRGNFIHGQVMKESLRIVASHEDKDCERILNYIIEYYIKEHKEEYNTLLEDIEDRFTNFLRYGNELGSQENVYINMEQSKK